MRAYLLHALVAATMSLPTHAASAQATAPEAAPRQNTPPPAAQTAPPALHQFIPLAPSVPVSPGQITLIALESRFAQEVAEGGGKAFASWFAEDAVTLSNGQPPVRGHAAIAAAATWDPRVYALTWVAEGAEMSPASDMGYTWGRYQGQTTDKDGKKTTQTGRYITIWKKQPDATWKVTLEASAEDAPGSSLLPIP